MKKGWPSLLLFYFFRVYNLFFTAVSATVIRQFSELCPRFGTSVQRDSLPRTRRLISSGNVTGNIVSHPAKTCWKNRSKVSPSRHERGNRNKSGLQITVSLQKRTIRESKSLNRVKICAISWRRKISLIKSFLHRCDDRSLNEKIRTRVFPFDRFSNDSLTCTFVL